MPIVRGILIATAFAFAGTVCTACSYASDKPVDPTPTTVTATPPGTASAMGASSAAAPRMDPTPTMPPSSIPAVLSAATAPMTSDAGAPTTAMAADAGAMKADAGAVKKKPDGGRP